MSTDNFGVDLMLDNNGDIMFTEDGDLLFTDVVEKKLYTNSSYTRFEGYIAIREWVHDCIATVIGSNIYDSDFGTNIMLYQSRSFTTVKQVVNQELEPALLKDARIKSVDYIKFQVVAINQINISVGVTTNTNQKPYEYVYPYVIGD